MKKLATIFSLFLLCSIGFSCKTETTAPAPISTAPPTNSIVPPTVIPPASSPGNDTEKVLNFSLKSDSNMQISLADSRDSVVVLFFFGSGCSSCKATSPNIQKIFVKGYENKKVKVIGLDTWDGNLAAVKSFRSLSNLTFPLLLEASGVAKTFETTYDRLLIIDKKGVVRFKGTQLAGNDISNAQKIVDEYLNK